MTTAAALPVVVESVQYTPGRLGVLIQYSHVTASLKGTRSLQTTQAALAAHLTGSTGQWGDPEVVTELTTRLAATGLAVTVVANTPPAPKPPPPAKKSPAAKPSVPASPH